jgi:hypothetical protein
MEETKRGTFRLAPPQAMLLLGGLRATNQGWNTLTEAHDPA